MKIEEVDQRTTASVQFLPDLGNDGGGEGQGRDGPIHGFVENHDHLARLFYGGDEWNKATVEMQIRELKEQSVAHRFGTDAG